MYKSRAFCTEGTAKAGDTCVFRKGTGQGVTSDGNRNVSTEVTESPLPKDSMDTIP